MEETIQKKEIYFCIDTESYTKQMLNNRGAVGYYDYLQARHGLATGVTPIVTSQLALMTFYQIGDYDAYICYKDKTLKIEEGMQLNESGYCLSSPTYCEDSDILDVFKSGYFDDMLGIKDAIVRLKKTNKTCMYAKDEFSSDDRIILCKDCEDECEYRKKQDSVSEDLSAEIDKYWNTDYEDFGIPIDDFYNIAHRIADWQRKQMMKEAIDAFIEKGSIRLRQWPLDEKYGKHHDKIKIIVFKEE